MSLFKNFCCCGNLITGGYVIGVMGMLFGIYVVISSAYGLHQLDNSGTTSQYFFYEIPAHVLENESYSVRSALVFAIVINILNIFSSTLLIVGTNKANHLHILPWLTGNLINIVFYFHEFFLKPVTPVVVNFVLFIIFYIYIWLCIYSLFQKFRDELYRQYKLQEIAAGQLVEENMVPLQPMNTVISLHGPGDASVINATQTRVIHLEDEAPPRYSTLSPRTRRDRTSNVNNENTIPEETSTNELVVNNVNHQNP